MKDRAQRAKLTYLEVDEIVRRQIKEEPFAYQTALRDYLSTEQIKEVPTEALERMPPTSGFQQRTPMVTSWSLGSGRRRSCRNTYLGNRNASSAMKVQRIGSERALKEARKALNVALGMKTMSPDLTTRATKALNDVNLVLTSVSDQKLR